MLLGLQIPRMGDLMKDGRIVHALVERGARIEQGTPLFEMRVDLSEIAQQNCSPIFQFRVLAQEAGWVRTVNGSAGDTMSVDAPFAIISTTEDESLDAPVVRPLRVNVGVVWLSDTFDAARCAAGG